MNMLSQALGISKKCPLRYVVRSAVAPVVFVDDFEERIFQMPITGPDFDLDNRNFIGSLKLSLLVPPDMHGLNGTIKRRTNGKLLKLGPTATMVSVSLVSAPIWRS